MIMPSRWNGHDGFLRWSTLAWNVSERVDLLCDLFEEELKAGRDPRLESYLRQSSPAARGQLLTELQALAQEYSVRQNSRLLHEISPIEIPRLGRYRFLERLGNGRLYRAYDEILKRDVALKLITGTTGKNNPSHADRFLRDARVLSSLDHSHLVPVVDYGWSPRYGGYLVYAYIAGADVSGLIRREKKLPPLHAVRLVRDAADALAYMHQRGILHRSLKPSSLRLTNDDRLLLANVAGDLDHKTNCRNPQKSMEPSRPEHGSFTIEVKSDLFALGSVLYELLTGEPPLSADLSAERAALQLRYLVPPIVKDRSIPQGVSDLCLYLLAENVADRPVSAYAVAVELRAILRRAHPIRRWLGSHRKPRNEKRWK